MKKCKICETPKPLKDFQRSKKVKSGYGANCLECSRKYQREWMRLFYKNNKEKLKKRKYKWVSENKEWHREWRKRRNLKLKIDVLSAYSSGLPKCKCCGEKEILFLSIDHILNNGKEDKQKKGIRGGTAMYQYLKNNNYPNKDEYQALCFNCNLAKGFYGKCPHIK